MICEVVGNPLLKVDIQANDLQFFNQSFVGHRVKRFGKVKNKKKTQLLLLYLTPSSLANHLFIPVKSAFIVGFFFIFIYYFYLFIYLFFYLEQIRIPTDSLREGEHIANASNFCHVAMCLSRILLVTESNEIGLQFFASDLFSVFRIGTSE